MADTPFDFHGRRALVTGGRSGIGRACVEALLAGGARVASLDVTAGDTESNQDVLELVVDVQAEAELARAVDEATSTLGGLDLVVLSAGVARDGVLWKLRPQDWDQTLGVNLTGSFNVMRLAVPHLRAAGHGAIVLVGSINGQRGKFGQSAYAASKAGVIGLAKSAARELGAFDIRVNVVSPGFVRTPMTAGLPDAIVEQARNESLLPRLSEAEDIAAAVCFLASEQARQITGTVLQVDAGQYV